MIVINPTKLLGPWQEGYVLDVHTTSSTLIGYDEFGHERFETVRTPLGEALYKLKYKSDLTVLEPLANTVADFLVTKGIHQTISLLTIVPPTNTRRRFQPNIELAKLVGMTLHVPVYLDYILKAKDISQLKDVSKIHHPLNLGKAASFSPNWCSNCLGVAAMTSPFGKGRLRGILMAD
ncbi:MAG: hypothetical protein HY671_11755 [Chloroflexi bacterium]|nr:hypothetical protein [Chloroflexota bacterium]